MKFNPSGRALEAVSLRLQGLQLEEKIISEIVGDQAGTSIPRAFNVSSNNFIIDPSNIGTGILDRMVKTDDTISAAVQFKIMMIVSKMGDYQHENPKIQEFVQGYLKGLRRPTWSESMEAMLSFHAYKFSVSEIVFGLDNQLRKVRGQRGWLSLSPSRPPCVERHVGRRRERWVATGSRYSRQLPSDHTASRRRSAPTESAGR